MKLDTTQADMNDESKVRWESSLEVFIAGETVRFRRGNHVLVRPKKPFLRP